MISKWLGDLPLDDFRRAHFQRAPVARAATALDAVPLLTWRTVERLLRVRVDHLVVRNSRLIETRVPDFRAAVELIENGCSLVLRRCERCDDGLRDLAEMVGSEMTGEVSIQVYVTPAGFHSFGWHYDCEDVFIVQTLGVKDYFLRENTVNPRPVLAAMPRDMQFERETTPISGSLLAAGDCLYVPRGWWHVAKCIATSLSISAGVLAPDARG
jgi:ribosomal protein L16 Arg81 hydroxylase